MWRYYWRLDKKVFKRIFPQGAGLLNMAKIIAAFGVSWFSGGMVTGSLDSLKQHPEFWPFYVLPFLLIVGSIWGWIATRINYEEVKLISPDLRIEYKQGGRYQQLDKRQGRPNPDNELLHRISIYNDGGKIAENVKVKLLDISPTPPDSRVLNKWLHVTDKNYDDFKDESCNINGQETIYIDVLAIPFTEGKGVRVMTIASGLVDIIPDMVNYNSIRLGIYAFGRKICERKFELKQENYPYQDDSKSPIAFIFHNRFSEIADNG